MNTPKSTTRAAFIAACILWFLLSPIPGRGQTLPGVISYWAADGDALDSVGSNHGNLHGEATFAPSLAGQGFDLTGAVDRVYMDQPFPPMAVGDDYSVSLWMKMAIPSPSWGALFETRLSNYYGFTIAVNPDGMLWIGGRCDNGYRDHGCNGPVSAPGAWHHVVAVFDWVADALIFYVDGELVDTGPLTGCNGITRSDKIFLGSTSLVSPSWEFSGMIDEVQVYGRALDSSEVGTLFSGPAVPVPEPDGNRSWGQVKSDYR